MNVFSMNVIWKYYICHYHWLVAYQHQLHRFTASANPLPWPHGIIRFPLDEHFRISLEIVGHPSAFFLTALWILWIRTYSSHTVFHQLYSREVCIFGCSRRRIARAELWVRVKAHHPCCLGYYITPWWVKD